MKKLLLFLALCSGAASASPVQYQIELPEAVAEQASVLTAEQRQQVVDQAVKNIQKLVDSCGDDKELLKTTLKQRIKNLLLTHPVAIHFAVILETCLEVTLLLVATYALVCGINFVAALAFGKQMLIANWFSKPSWLFMLGYRIGFNVGFLQTKMNELISSI